MVALLTHVGMIFFVSLTGGYVAARQRGATAGNQSLGDQPLDLQQPHWSHADANGFLVPVTETAQPPDCLQMDYLRQSCDMPQPTSPQLPPTGFSTFGDRCFFDDDANDTSGEQSPTPTESNGLMNHRLQTLQGIPGELSMNHSQRSENDKHASAEYAGAAVDDNAGPQKRHRIRATSRDPALPGGDAFIIATTVSGITDAPEKQPRS